MTMVPYPYEANKHLLVDSVGRRLTAGLFEELSPPDAMSKPVFRLSDWRKTYVAISDPTDYQAALVLIGDWEHWLLLLKCPSFVAELEKWREEVNQKLKSEAVLNLVKQSKQPQGTAAARWLAEHGYIEKSKQKLRTKQKEGEDGARVAEDAKRLKLVGGNNAV